MFSGDINAQKCTVERITWSPDLQLHIGDFLARPGNPQHTAEANTGIATQSKSGTKPGTFEIAATSFFDPCKSWFRKTKTDSLTLAHEQLHFDITELYARRMLARYDKEISDYDVFLRKHKAIYNDIWEQSRRTQQKYDKEVYADRARQAWWEKWVAKELAKYTTYAEHMIVLPM